MAAPHNEYRFRIGKPLQISAYICAHPVSSQARKMFRMFQMFRNILAAKRFEADSLHGRAGFWPAYGIILGPVLGSFRGPIWVHSGPRNEPKMGSAMSPKMGLAMSPKRAPE